MLELETDPEASFLHANRAHFLAPNNAQFSDTLAASLLNRQ